MTREYKLKDTTKGTSHDLHFHLESRYFHFEHHIFHVIGPTRPPVVHHSSFCIMLYSRVQSRSDSTRASDEAWESVVREGRDVGWVVGVDLDGPEVGFLEVDEEARDKDCCEAVIAI